MGLLDFLKRQKVKKKKRQNSLFALVRSVGRLRRTGKGHMCLGIAMWGLLPVPRHLLLRAVSPGMQLAVIVPQHIAFPGPGSLGLWDVMLSEVTRLSVQALWVFVPPSSAECKHTLSVSNFS